jgi:hypothetical protein
VGEVAHVEQRADSRRHVVEGAEMAGDEVGVRDDDVGSGGQERGDRGVLGGCRDQLPPVAHLM